MIWVTCGGKMMSLHHGWGFNSIQTDSCIHIRHIQSVWAHWYGVNRHTVAVLHSYTHPAWLRFLWSGSLVELRWCHYVIVEAAIIFKLLPVSILDIYNVFEYINMLSIGHNMAIALVSYTHPTGSDFGVLSHLWSQNDVIMSWLRLPSNLKFFLHPY